jgi:hypothetical protein
VTILVLIGIILNLLLTFVKGLLGFDIQDIYLVGVDLLIVDPIVEGLIDLSIQYNIFTMRILVSL